MTIFYTSDLHLWHERIIELCNRPFSGVEEMNDKIIENWNYEVGYDDTVYILGDLALGTIRESLLIVPKLNGHKLLVPGNHDRVWSGYPHKAQKAEEMLNLYKDAGLTILPEQVSLTNNWKLCHFPTSGDNYTDDRYPEYRPTLEPDEWLIHGHVHNLWTVKGRQINVGVDVWDFTPVRQEVLEKIIALGPVEE